MKYADALKYVQDHGPMPEYDDTIQRKTARKYIDVRYWDTFGEEVVNESFVAWVAGGGKVHPKRAFICTLRDYYKYAKYRSHDALRIDVTPSRRGAGSGSTDIADSTFLDFSMSDLGDLKPVAECIASGMSIDDTAKYLRHTTWYVKKHIEQLRNLLSDYNR